MAWIKAYQNQVNIGFWRGAELTDLKGLLEGDGDRMQRIKLSRRADILQPALKRFVKEAAKLNQALGDPTQRKKEPPLPKTSGGLGLAHRGQT